MCNMVQVFQLEVIIYIMMVVNTNVKYNMLQKARKWSNILSSVHQRSKFQ